MTTHYAAEILRRAFQRIGRINFFTNIVCSIVNVVTAVLMFSVGGAFQMAAVGFLLAAAVFAFAARMSWKTWRD